MFTKIQSHRGGGLTAMRKTVSIFLALSMVLASLSISFADITSSGSTGSTPVSVTAESANFSVTVPSSLPVSVAADGTVTVSNAPKIVNNSNGPVKVSNVVVTTLNDWLLVSSSTNFKQKAVDLKEFSLKINNIDVTGDGDIPASFSSIPGNDDLSFSYASTVSAQSSAVTQAMANVVFTVVWDKVLTLEDYSWEELSAMAANGTASSKFSIGDTKTIHVEGTIGTLEVNQDLKAVLIGFNHDGSTGMDFQIMMDADDNKVALVDDNYGSSSTDGTKYFNMNHWGNFNYGGWAASDLRYDILGSTDTAPDNYGSARTSGDKGYNASSTTATNPVANTYMAALPSDLRAQMKPMTVYTDNVGGGTGNVESNVSSTIDYLPLLSVYEIFTSYTYVNSYEANHNTRYEYYEQNDTNADRKLFKSSDNSAAARWWGRSPGGSDRNIFCDVNASGNAGYISASRSRGLAPAFRI